MAEEVVGAYVRTMAMVWARLDERYGNPLMIVDRVHKEIEGLNSKTLGRVFIPRFYSKVRSPRPSRASAV